MSMEAFDPIATGQRVKRQREARGWSQQALADAAGLASRTIRRIEKGTERGVQLHSFARLYQALNVTPNDLLGAQDAEGTKVSAIS